MCVCMCEMGEAVVRRDGGRGEGRERSEIVLDLK